jgi:hypothetical protein
MHCTRSSPQRCWAALASAALAACAGPALAADRYWSYSADCGAWSDFASALCWRQGPPGTSAGGMPAAPPGASDRVLLVSGGAANLTVNYANLTTAGLPQYAGLVLSGTGTGVMALDMARNNLVVRGEVAVGQPSSSALAGRGRINQTGGSAQFSGLQLHGGSSYSVSGGRLSSGSLLMNAGSSFSQTGGTVTTGPLLRLEGRYILDAGTLDVGASIWQPLPGGTLEIGGGWLQTSSARDVAVANLDFIGGDGQMLQNTRLNVTTLNLRSDYEASRLVTLNQAVTAGSLNVGGAGSNSIEVRFAAGTHTVGGTLNVSAAANQSSFVTLQNAGTVMSTQGLQVGPAAGSGTGIGRVFVNDGARLEVTGTAGVGRAGVASDPSVLVAQGGALTVNGSLNVWGGALVSGANGRIGVSGATTVGNGGQFSFLSIDDGGVFSGEDLLLLGGSELTLNNGSILRGTVGATLRNAAQMRLAGNALVEHRIVNQSTGRLQVEGNARAVFGNGYSGAGALDISTGAVVSFRGEVELPADGSITGAGRSEFSGRVTLPESGRFSVASGGLQLLDGAELRMVINGLTPDAAAPALLRVGGSLGFGGVLALQSGPVSLGQRFNLFDWGSSTGRFSGLDFSMAPLPADWFWDTAELYTQGVLRVSPVPEPGTWALWLAGVACLGAMTRRRHGSSRAG